MNDPLGVDSVVSVAGVAIRLTRERWTHITARHPELADFRDAVLSTVERPNRVLEGGDGELLAICETEPGKCLVVAYREGDADGFILTAFLTRRMKSLSGRPQRWP